MDRRSSVLEVRENSIQSEEGRSKSPDVEQERLVVGGAEAAEASVWKQLLSTWYRRLSIMIEIFCAFGLVTVLHDSALRQNGSG